MVNKTKGMLEMLFSVFNMRYDLTMDALKHNENRIKDSYPFGHEPKPTTMIPFGIHLGETMIANIPGTKWVDEELESIFDIKLEIPTIKPVNKIITFPLRRVNKFWQEDRQFNFSSFLNTFSFIQNNDMTDPIYISEADSEGWYHIPGGDVFKITIEPNLTNVILN